jgi:hypothetical protein
MRGPPLINNILDHITNPIVQAMESASTCVPETVSLTVFQNESSGVAKVE